MKPKAGVKSHFEENLEIYLGFVEEKEAKIVENIYKKFKYQGMPYRLYPRNDFYEDIKNKLYSNLHYAVKLVKEEGTRIIKRYRRLEYYIEELSFGRRDTRKA